MRARILRPLISWFIVLCAASASDSTATATTAFTSLSSSGYNFYRLAAVAPGRVVGTTVDGTLVMSTLQSVGGSMAWQAVWNSSLGGSFAFSLAVGNDGANGTQIVVGTADGLVQAFRAVDGQRMFKTDLAHAVYSLAMVDAHGDGHQLLFAGTANGTLALLRTDGSVQQSWLRPSSAIRTLVAGRFAPGEGAQQLFIATFPDDSTCEVQVLRLQQKNEEKEAAGLLGSKGASCPEKRKGVCMAPAQNGTVLLSFNTDTPFLCCINCSTFLQCGAWSWKEKEASAFSQNKGNGTCTLLTAPGQVTKSAACQCGSSPAPSPGSSWQLIPLNSQWKNPVKESGIGRSSHGLNAIAVRFSNSALNTADSIVSSSGIMHPATTTGVLAHFVMPFPPLQYADAYRMKSVAARGSEVLMVFGMDVYRFHVNDASIKAGLINSSESARSNLSFSDVISVPSPSEDTFLMGSAPNGDDTVYHLNLSTGDNDTSKWVSEVEARSWQGRIAQINEAVDDSSSISNNASFAVPTTITINLEAYVKIGGATPGSKGGGNISALVNELISRHRYYSARFPYPARIRFAVEFAFYEDYTSYWKKPDGTPWDMGNAGKPLPRSALMDQVVAPLVMAKVPFIIRAGHAGSPYISPDTAKQVMSVAGAYCIGFSTAENHNFGGPDYPGAGNPGEYLIYAVQPVMEMCLETGCRFFFNEKGTFWSSVATTNVSRILLHPRFLNVTTPSAEDSNSRTPDLNLGARAGLFMTGAVGAWKARLVADTFAFNRLWDWSKVMVGHPHWRAILVQIVLGAKFLGFDCAQRFVDDATSAGTAPQPKTTGVLEHGLAQLLHLLGRGVIYAPVREDILLPPVTLRTANISTRFMLSGTGGHDYRTLDSDAQDVRGELALGRLENMWGMAATGAHDAAAVLYGRTRQFGNFIPGTNRFGGLPVIVPTPGDPAAAAASGGAVFRTDGDALHDEDGKRVSSDELLAAALAASAGALPFSFAVSADAEMAQSEAPQVFMQQLVLRSSPDRGADGDGYLVYLVNRGYTDPQARVVGRLELGRALRLGGGKWRVRDRVSGLEIGQLGAAGGGGVEVAVEAGCFRVLEAVSSRGD